MHFYPIISVEAESSRNRTQNPTRRAMRCWTSTRHEPDRALPRELFTTFWR